MERIFCSDDIVVGRTVFLYTVFSCHLDHRLIGLCPRILEEDLVHADRRTNLLRQKRLRDSVGIIKRMHDVVHLILHRSYDLFVAVSRAVYRDACVEVQISLPVFVIDVHVLRALRDHGETLVCIDHVFCNKSFDVFLCISCLCQSHVLLLQSFYSSPLICK